MSDFSDRPLVAGSLIGLRAFAVDNLGRLYGPTYNQVFRPGENEAECRQRESDPYGIGSMQTYLRMMTTAPWSVPPTATLTTRTAEPAKPAKVEEKPKHTAGNIECHCGFYAYFDGGNDYKKAARVAALIEGYGVCTVGSRGFRSQKARVVALVAPGHKFPEARFQLVLRNYPDVPVYANRGAALAEHPLTVPDAPSPDAPGFWDRPVTA